MAKNWQETWTENYNKITKRCSKCLFDENTPNITFDENGLCNYCKVDLDLRKQFPGGNQGWKKLKEIAAEIKRTSKKSAYDIAVGLSGGADSSYMLLMAKELGLRAIAVHYDNSWDSTIAVENINNVTTALDIPLWTYVVDNEEYDDIYRSFFKAGTADMDAPTDIALATTMYMACDKFKIKHIFEGHNFRTEGLAPLGWNYMDPMYIYSIHKQFGNKKMKTYPNLWLRHQFKWMALKKIKKIRPFWYVDVNKEAIIKELTDNYGWKWYGGHHMENRLTSFIYSYVLPRRFGIDLRYLGHSALVRSGQLDRGQGIKELSQPPNFDPELVDMAKKRLGFSDEEFDFLLDELPHKTFRDYKTYKPVFEKLRPFIYMLAKAELVPMSFYIKYTSKDNI